MPAARVAVTATQRRPNKSGGASQLHVCCIRFAHVVSFESLRNKKYSCIILRPKGLRQSFQARRCPALLGHEKNPHYRRNRSCVQVLHTKGANARRIHSLIGNSVHSFFQISRVRARTAPCSLAARSWHMCHIVSRRIPAWNHRKLPCDNSLWQYDRPSCPQKIG